VFQIKVVDEIKTRILCSITFFEHRAVYEIMLETLVEEERLQMAIWWHIAY
jgi:hypothetical protein